jgi:hypothetical protein
LIEQQDIILDVVWTSGDPDQAVSEVLRRGAELLIPCGSSASVAAKRQTSIIPIVFLSVGDPIAMGLTGEDIRRCLLLALQAPQGANFVALHRGCTEGVPFLLLRTHHNYSSMVRCSRVPRPSATTAIRPY